MFGGYLLLGWALWRYRWPPLWLRAPVAVAALIVTDWAVLSDSLDDDCRIAGFRHERFTVAFKYNAMAGTGMMIENQEDLLYCEKR